MTRDLRDRGSISILTLGVIAVIFLLSLGLADASVIARARVRAVTAADAAALAGAAALDAAAPNGDAVVRTASCYARANGAEMVGAPGVDVAMSAVTVRVAVEAHLRLLPVRHVQARSRARLVDVAPETPRSG